MPKAKRPGNQHNSRHENGIVAPGKRISKQKSNGHLNGHTEQPDAGPIPAPSSPTFATGMDFRSGGATSATKGSALTTAIRSNEVELEHEVHVEQEPNGGDSLGGNPQESHRPSDVKMVQHQGASSSGVLNLAFTILRACPLGDTIAILLVLLWLPPTLLTVTNTLFAVLTFMPGTFAFPSFPPTLNDIFVGTGSTPSLATVFITDIIGLVLWLVMWTPIQTWAIELAKAVVATTLGGGSAGKRKSSDTTILCMSLVTMNHVARHEWLPRRIFGLDWPAVLSSIPYVPQSLSLSEPDEDVVATRSPAGWIRVIVALHILIQGMVHVLRRWYQKREYALAVQASKKSDAEVAASPAGRNSSNVVTADAGGHGHQGSSVEGPARMVTSKESREKIINGKKKRRQGTVVRSQQPLWAAFAATKLTVLREYEQSQALKEVADAKATDIKNLGNVPFAAEADRVWISDLTPNSFRFSTNIEPQDARVSGAGDGDLQASLSNPESLHVRVNDTDWTSIKVEREREASTGREIWQGEVFGLSPACSYRCAFVLGKGGVTLYSLTVTTPPLLPDDNDNSALSTGPSQQAYRPSSPTSPRTTIKRSIAAFENILGETQAKQKRSKKENKTALAGLKKDIEVLNSKITKLGGEDKAQLNRQMQWNSNAKQADEAIAYIADEIEGLGSLPGNELQEAEVTKTAWDEVNSGHAAALDELGRVKATMNREKSAVQTEANTSLQKRERLQTRKSKLADQLERLEAATADGMDAKERKNSAQAAKDLERFELEQRNAEQMNNILQAYQQSRSYVQQAWQQIQTLESAFHDQQQQMMTSQALPEVRPLTPEGDLPGTNPNNAQAYAFRASAFGSPDAPNIGLRSHSGSLRQNGNRPRSTSGVSGGSIYADFEDQDPAPPMPARAIKAIREKGRQHSAGSGSGSSSGQRDPASPLVGSGARTSPVGKRSPVWNSQYANTS